MESGSQKQDLGVADVKTPGEREVARGDIALGAKDADRLGKGDGGGTADGKIKGRGRGNEAESRPADMIDRRRRFTEQPPEFPGGAPTAFRSLPVERRERDLVPIHGDPSLPSPPRG